MVKNTDDSRWWLNPAAAIDELAIAEARARQLTLTKPQGSLGRLEDIALSFAGWQGRPKPLLENIRVRVFAADHGVCAQGVSAFPQVVTTQMIDNFVSGGAAVSVLAKNLGADFAVVNLGTVSPVAETQGLIDRFIAPGTKDFSIEPAMSYEQCLSALAVGREMSQPCHLFIGGEMGIGNTSSAAAIFSALLGVGATKTVGRGTGIDDASLRRKTQVVANALELHAASLGSPFAVLQNLGGFEIAALAGAYIANAQSGIPNVIDGFISTAAALIAMRLNPSVRPWCCLAHLSSEAAHADVLEEFVSPPLLNLGMRLGEGSGAVLAVAILKAAIDLHNNMATFADAKVSEQE